MDGHAEAEITIVAKGKSVESPGLPSYLVDTYTWAYLRPSSLTLLDNHLVVATILWGNFWKLVGVACREFESGQHVLQAASVYGNLSAQLARTVGKDGHLEIIDIAPLQVQHCSKKLSRFPQVSVRLADAAAPGEGTYDGVCCFFLLHEIPDTHKRAVVDALLERVAPGSKVVFVDYHKPHSLHPVRPVMYGVFRWLEPFANGLINSEIQNFASDADAFTWRKELFFGGLYQKVVAVRRA